jgi:hypothetical protein
VPNGWLAMVCIAPLEPSASPPERPKASSPAVMAIVTYSTARAT